MGGDVDPKVKPIDHCVTPPTRVFHPDLRVGDNLEQTEIWNATWWRYTFKTGSVQVFQRMIYRVKEN